MNVTDKTKTCSHAPRGNTSPDAPRREWDHDAERQDVRSHAERGNEMIKPQPPGGATGLVYSQSGYWVAERNSVLSYPEDGNDLCFSLEDDSFWFRHRNELIVETLRQFPPSGPLFDVGGGNGYVAAGLERAGFATVLVEPGRTGAENACRRGLHNVINATTDEAGFAPASLDAVGLFDVLEHIPDDLGFLQSLHRLMKPGGRIYLTVPAFQLLWSSEDDYAGHQRRYRRKSLANVLRAAGFDVEYLSYCFWFLPLPVFVLRAIPSWLGWRKEPTKTSATKEHSTKRGLAGWLFNRALSWELARVARGKQIWIGNSCLAVARKGSVTE